MPSIAALLSIALMSCVMSAAVLGSLLRAHVGGVGRWCLAYAIFSVGIVLILANARLPLWLGTAFSHGLFLLGGFLVLQGTREYFGKRKAAIAEYALVAAIYLALLFFIYIRPDLDARVVVASGYFSYVRAAIGWTVFRHRPADRPKYSYYFLGIAASAGALFHLARSIVYGSGWDHATAFLAPSALNIAFLGLGILSFPFMSIGMVMLAHDRMAERMERLATIDELTGALVRRAFMERAEAVLKASQVSGKPLAVAILDLDNFKAVNDRFGHAAGDRALAHFASAVSGSLRSGELFGRLGGEEFALLFPAAGKDEALKLTNDLRLAIAAHPCGETPYTFSAGVDEFGPDEPLPRVLARADAALYAAKALGRDRVVEVPSHGQADQGVEQPG